MNQRTVIIRGTQEFAKYYRQWNRLWASSRVTSPCCQAENLVQSVETLWPEKELLVIAVFHESKLVAGLPLIGSPGIPGMNIWPTIELPNNEWGCWGDLMVHTNFETPSTYNELVQALDQLPNHLMLRLNLVPMHQPQWKMFFEEFKKHRGDYHCSPAYEVGIIEHDLTWEQFESQLSSGFKKKLRKYERKLSEIGQLDIEIVSDVCESKIESYLQRVMDIENRSWKHASDTTIESKGKSQLFLDQAIELANKGALVISFLKLDGQDIAFDFGMTGKKTYHSWKIGYDQAYAKYSPGNYLTKATTLYFHETGFCDFQDTLGPISSATANWSTSTKSISNVTLPGKMLGAAIGLRWVFYIKSMLRRKLAAPRY